MNDFRLVTEIFPAHICCLWAGSFVINFVTKRVFVHKIMIP